jgi:hypothetical protein
MFRIRVPLKGSLGVAAQGAPTSFCRSMLAEGVKHVVWKLMIIMGDTMRGWAPQPPVRGSYLYSQ